MAKFRTLAVDILDALYDNTATNTTPLKLGTNGAVTYTRPFVLRLTTTLCTDSAAGTEVSGGSYAAQNINTMSAASAASPSSKASSASVSFSNMPACTWADIYVTDSTGTPKLMNFKGTPSLAKTVNAGDTCIVSTLTATEA
jgi:hypothetical protein